MVESKLAEKWNVIQPSRSAAWRRRHASFFIMKDYIAIYKLNFLRNLYLRRFWILHKFKTWLKSCMSAFFPFRLQICSVAGNSSGFHLNVFLICFFLPTPRWCKPFLLSHLVKMKNCCVPGSFFTRWHISKFQIFIAECLFS